MYLNDMSEAGEDSTVGFILITVLGYLLSYLFHCLLLAVQLHKALLSLCNVIRKSSNCLYKLVMQ